MRSWGLGFLWPARIKVSTISLMIIAGTASISYADTIETYSLIKGFVYTAPPGTVVVGANQKYWEKAWTYEPPAGQPFRCNVDPVQASDCPKGGHWGSIPVGPAGLPATVKSADLISAPNSADGDTVFVVNPFTKSSTTLTGAIGVFGQATATAPLGTTTSIAAAKSLALQDVEYKQLKNNKTGSISVTPVVNLEASTSIAPGRDEVL